MNRLRIGIVGAGLGGLSAGARLAASGHDVEIFDSQSFPGGKAGSQSEKGYRFDTGPSIVTMPEVFEQLFTEVGERLEEYIELEPLDEICRYEFSDKSRLSSYSDRNKFANEIGRTLNDTAESVANFLDHAARIYQITADLFLWNSLHEIGTYLKPRVVARLFSLRQIAAFRTMDASIRTYFCDPRSVQLFDRYATYNGSNPYDAPGTLNIIPHVEYGLGALAAVKGIHSIAEGVARLAIAKGARIELSTRVESIEYDSTRRITGLVVKGERRAYDIVISNSDVIPTYLKLLRDDEAPILKRYERLEPSSSGVVFLFGVRREHSELGLHNIFFSNDYQKEFSEIFEERIVPTDPTIYLNITSKVNREDAPRGCENWFVLVNAPYDSGQDWDAQVASTRVRVLERLSKFLESDIEQHIETEAVMTPIDIEGRTGSRYGSLYGISSNTRLAAFLRHPNRSRRYRGLYFCGGSAHPGGGMPLVILSGKIVSDIITKRWNRGRV